ncbi:MAG TPA: (d)CMP kinase [Candidatus Saccharimonadales bacterium]|nr:(d)CMP kinase [Candidatus Saccharimonadales bacterium]
MSPPVVTIDGPAGSGKTTLGRRLAVALSLPLVDTGLLYRGVMVAAARARIDPHDRPALIACARSAEIVIDVDPTHDDADSSASVNGVEAGPALRDPANAPLLAAMSSIPEVRAALLSAQRSLATGGAVAVGRDCGTVVFPDAKLKLYLDASEDVRARRRARQLGGVGSDIDSALMRGEVRGRDQQDATRSAAPMRAAHDAHVIDTGVLGIAEVYQEALELWAAASSADGQ